MIDAPLLAQDAKIDSLKRVISLMEKKQGYEKEVAYFSVLYDWLQSLYVYPNKRDSSALIAEKIVALAQKARDEYWEAKGYNVLAFYYSYGRNIPKSNVYFTEKVLPVFRKLPDKRELAFALHYYANSLRAQNLLDKAIATYYESLQLFNQMSLQARINGNYEVILERLGDVYETIGNKQKAKKYYEEALQFMAQHKPKSDSKYSTLINMNFILISEKRFEEAVKNFYIVLKIMPQHLKSNFYIANKGLGDIYKELKQIDSTKKYFQQAEKIARQLPNKSNLSFILHSLAVLHIDENDLESALRTEEEALSISQKMNMRESVKVNYGLLSDIYQSKGDYQKALKYHQAFKSLSDSLAGEQNNREIGKLEANYEFGKKEIVFLREQEIKKLENDRLRQDVFLQEVETEKQMLVTSQTEDRNTFLTKENLAKENEKKQQARLFEAEKKRKEAENQQKLVQQRWYAYMLAGSLGTVLLILLLIWRNNRQKQKANTLLTHKNITISQQKEEITTQAEMLDITNKTKDQLFSIIAHDLRSPMIAFQGLNTQIQYFLRKNQPEKLQELGEDLEESTQRLNNLLNNLLQWAMVQKNALQINTQTFSLHEAVNHTFEHFKWIAQTHHITLENKVLPEVTLETDYNILQTILRNLISNALKFTSKAGKIIVDGQASSGAWQLTVKDTGIGITPEKLQALFGSPQLNSTTGVRGDKGVGIGLQLCYELSQQIEAKLTVESEEDKGTIFTVSSEQLAVNSFHS